MTRMWTTLFEGPVHWARAAAALVPTLVLAWLAARIARRLTSAAMRTVVGDTLAASSPLVRGPLRLVGVVTFIVILAVVLFPAFELAGLQLRNGQHLPALADWSYKHGLRVLVIIVIAFAFVRVIGLLVTRFEHELNVGTSLDALERAKRARTLGAVINKVVTISVISIALLE